MGLPNKFNIRFNPADAGDNTILADPPTAKSQWRVRQLDIQNRSTTTDTDIKIKVDGNVIFGPILFPAKALMTVELVSAGHREAVLDLPRGKGLVINSSAAVDLLAFGEAEMILVS